MAVVMGNGIKARLARSAQDYEASLASVKKYEREIIPQTTKSLELSEQAYKVGELAFLQVLVIRRSYYEATELSCKSKPDSKNQKGGRGLSTTVLL